MGLCSSSPLRSTIDFHVLNSKRGQILQAIINFLHMCINRAFAALVCFGLLRSSSVGLRFGIESKEMWATSKLYQIAGSHHMGYNSLNCVTVRRFVFSRCPEHSIPKGRETKPRRAKTEIGASLTSLPSRLVNAQIIQIESFARLHFQRLLSKASRRGEERLPPPRHSALRNSHSMVLYAIPVHQ